MGFSGETDLSLFFCNESGSCLMVPSFPPRPSDLAVRLGCGPCAEEQAFLSKRKQVVAKALKQALQLDEDLQEDEVCGLSRLGWASSDLLERRADCF